MISIFSLRSKTETKKAQKTGTFAMFKDQIGRLEPP